jgi:iron complex outermembrane receptor protein
MIVFIGITGLLHGYTKPADGSVIRGKVTDTAGNALPGADITIANSFLGTHSGINGDYAFTGLRDGIYTLRFSFLGYETREHVIRLTGEAEVNMILSPRPFITGEVVVSGTRAGAFAPFAYSTLENTELRKQNAGQDLPYLLSLTPSLVETSEAGNGIGYTSLRIRGTDGSRINVTVDGIPLNDPESQQVFWVDLPDLASSVENIQVQRGAGTSSNGAGAFGASINIQTKSPDNEPFAEISSMAGSFGTFKNVVTAGTGLMADKFAMQLRYSDIKSDGFIDRTGSDHRSLFITGIYRTGRSSLKTNIILGEEHTGIGWWGVPREKLQENRRYNPAGEYTDADGVVQYYDNESDNYVQNHAQMIYSLKISKPLMFNAALHYTKGKGYYEEFKEDGAVSEYGLLPVSIGGQEFGETDLIRRKWMSNDFFGLVYSLNYKKDRVEGILGGGLNRYSGDHFGRIIWMRFAGNTDNDHEWYRNKGLKKEFNIYGKVNYSLTDITSVFGDLQYRKIVYDMNGIDSDLKDLGQSHSFNFINPKAGVFFSLNSNQDAWVSFSVANREPTRTDFKEAAGDPDATPLSETLYDPEIGYKLRTGRSSFSVNLYGMFYKDQLVPTGELSAVGYPIMTNVPESYRLGAEISAGFKPADPVEWQVNLTLSRNKIVNFMEYYTDYISSTDASEYKNKPLGTVDIAYSPSVTASSDLGIRLFNGLKVHLVSKFVGKQYFDNTMNEERKIDPYLVNNLRFDYEPVIGNIKNAEIQLLVNNLFNARYESNAYGGNWYEDGIENTWAYYFPQAGINFMARIALKF